MTNGEGRSATLPNVKTDFNQAAQNNQQANHSRSDDTAQKNRGIATAAELEALKKARETPVLEPHLTPGGTVEQEVHTQVSKDREERIQYLDERLNRHDVKAEFNKTAAQKVQPEQKVQTEQKAQTQVSSTYEERVQAMQERLDARRNLKHEFNSASRGRSQ